MSIKGDPAPITTTSVDTNSEMREMVDSLRMGMPADSKRSENYLRDFGWEHQLAISVTLSSVNWQPVAFSTVFRPPHYPQNCARMLNRYYIDPDYRALSNAR